jgi:hypothetical protein
LVIDELNGTRVTLLNVLVQCGPNLLKKPAARLTQGFRAARSIEALTPDHRSLGITAIW